MRELMMNGRELAMIVLFVVCMYPTVSDKSMKSNILHEDFQHFYM